VENYINAKDTEQERIHRLYLLSILRTSIKPHTPASYSIFYVFQPTMATAENTKPSFPSFDPNNCQTYAASCHCGAVQYDVLLSPPLQQWKVVSCNCSICSRHGYLLVYPQRSQVNMRSGEEALKNHSFGPKRLLHKFCGRCGSSVFFDPRMAEFGEAPPDLLGVNVSRQLSLSY
jgi:hypothetical protein